MRGSISRAPPGTGTRASPAAGGRELNLTIENRRCRSQHEALAQGPDPRHSQAVQRRHHLLATHAGAAGGTQRRHRLPALARRRAGWYRPSGRWFIRRVRSARICSRCPCTASSATASSSSSVRPTVSDREQLPTSSSIVSAGAASSPSRAAPGTASSPANRRARRFDKRCVWKTSGEMLAFHESHSAELSSIAVHGHDDVHATKRRSAGLVYDVETVTLNDLLDQHDAPQQIDYLSIDTEGSEFDILEAFDFGATRHQRDHLRATTTPRTARGCSTCSAPRGYRRRSEEVSQFDDWYVKAAALSPRERSARAPALSRRRPAGRSTSSQQQRIDPRAVESDRPVQVRPP